MKLVHTRVQYKYSTLLDYLILHLLSTYTWKQPRIQNHLYVLKTSLLCRLQAQTLPDATPPIGKIHPFSKMAVTFEPLMGFDALQDLDSSLSL